MMSEMNESGSRLPRLLIVVSTNQRRGAEVFAEHLRNGLERRGWAVEAVSLSSVSDRAIAGVEPLTTVAPSMLGALSTSALAALRRKIRAFTPDVILANGGSTLRYSVLARRRRGSRLVYVGIGESLYWIRSNRSRQAMRFLLRRTDRVLAVSQRSLDQMVELEPSLRDRIYLAHTGVPDVLFDLDSSSPEGPLRIVMVGSLSAEKDPALALRAAALIPEALIRFVGSGPLHQDLLEEAVRLDVSDRVEFVGSVDDVGPHLEWAHVLVLTSKTEGLPGALLEAGAASLPSVAVDVGGVREIVVDGETGFVTLPNDLDSLSAALTAINDDRSRLQQMGVAARRRIRANFSIDTAMDNYAELLRDLVE
jgi:glycosyltransferase involved in cell wall biosynthesis